MSKIKVTINMPLDVEDGAIQKGYGIPFIAKVKTDKGKVVDVYFEAEVEEKDVKSLLDAGKIIKASKC